MSEAEKPTKTPLTLRETEVVVMAMQCLQGGEIKIDYDKLTAMAEYKNKHSTNAVFSSIKMKLSKATLENHFVAHGGAAVTAAAKKRAAKPKAAAKETATNDGEVADNDATPEKPKKKRAPKAKAPVVENTSDNEKTPPTLAPKKKRATKASSEAPEPKRVKKSPEAKEEIKPEIKPEVKSEDTLSELEAEAESENFFDAALEPSSA
ncbi:MAG: hypothetical protein LQ346_007225 [Caloplaca aetnensis]|nr:MAG: hypothetical protein LQ346_007225 [Caloplaca aetnensis]